MEYLIFLELIIISVLAIPVVLICHKIRIPVIVGFLLTGIFINPQFGLFRFINVHHVEFLSELGVVCLLFSIGLEFSFKRLKEIGSPLFIGGTLQVALTVVITGFLLYYLAHKNVPQSIFLGCVISLSSTALVFALFQDKGFAGFTYVKITQAILIYQDIAAILMVIFLPLLAAPMGNGVFVSQMTSLFYKFIILAVTAALFHFAVVPYGLYYVAKTRSRELFVIAILFIFMSFAGLAGYLKISMALGAFLAGVLISESPYNHRAMGVILPFKDLFLSIFFISIGILLDLSFLVHNFHIIVLITLIIVLIKFTAAFIAAAVLRRSLETALLCAAALSQLGEFSFVLFQTGLKINMIGKAELDYLLAAAILSIIITPFLLNFMTVVGLNIKKKGIRFALLPVSCSNAENDEKPKGHVVIIGYGIIGRRVALGARMAGLDYCVIEFNPDTQKRESEKGVPIFYGDASQETVLEHANISEAAIVAVTVPQHESAVAITDAVRRHNRTAQILVRTRFDASVKELKELGADSVYAEEKEISMEMLSKILRLSFISSGDIEGILLSQTSEEDSDDDAAHMSEIADFKKRNDIRYIKIEKDSCIAGRTLAEIDLRRRHGISAIMIKRGDKEYLNPEPDKKLNPGDFLVVIGKRESLAEFVDLCSME